MLIHTHNASSHEQKPVDTAIIVLHEIYGINQHIRNICTKYYTWGYDVYCPSLYEPAHVFSYAEQETAYAFFMKHVGLNDISQIKTLASALWLKYTHVIVAGFSVGATLAWICASHKICSGAIAYYGSRIRDFIDLSPQCPVLALFACNEETFDPTDLVKRLQQYPHVLSKLFDAHHGFSNPHASTFDPASTARAAQVEYRFIADIKAATHKA